MSPGELLPIQAIVTAFNHNGSTKFYTGRFDHNLIMSWLVRGKLKSDFVNSIFRFLASVASSPESAQTMASLFTVVTSVFTAVTVTRMFVAHWLRTKRPTTINI